MKNTFVSLACGIALAISGTPGLAQIRNAAISSSGPVQNVFCEKNLKATVTRVGKAVLPSGYSDLKDVQLNSDFRFPKNDLPYSQPLAFNDPVTGQSVGVYDQNFIPGGSKVSSSWGRFGISIGGVLAVDFWRWIDCKSCNIHPF